MEKSCVFCSIVADEEKSEIIGRGDGCIAIKDLFPVALSGVPFSATETEQRYFTAQVTFKYTIFDVIDVNGAKV